MRLIKIENLNDYQKIYLTYKIFDYWSQGKIKNNKKVFLPKDIEILNINDVIIVYKVCSNIENNEEVDEIIEYFKELDFYSQLDFMIYLFDIVNDIKKVPNYLTDNISLKDLSDKILQYKLLA